MAASDKPISGPKSGTKKDAPAKSGVILDRHWHLSNSDDEIALTDLEIALFRTFAAFDAWQFHSQAAAADTSLNRTDCIVLNLVRMKERPKTAAEVTRLLNREDITNIQYSLRKLEKLDLIRLAPSRRQKTKAYEVTEKGLEATDRHAQLRREVLTKTVGKVKDWQIRAEDAAALLDHLRALYEHASMVVTIHKGEAFDGD